MISFEAFQKCSNAYRSAPFWSWNKDLNHEELKRQIQEMHQQGIGGFFMHPRGGMTEEYLGESYMEAVRMCIEEAQRLGMKAWLYDEDRFPSGGAGGLVVPDNPDFRAKELVLQEVASQEFTRKEEWMKVFSIVEREDGQQEVKDLTAWTESEIRLLDQQLLLFKVAYVPERGLWNNQSYTDLAYKPAVDKFIEVTYEKYKQDFKDYFGDVVPGIFTDEPNFNVERGGEALLPWTYELEEYFQKHKGYNLLDHLPALFKEVEGYRKIRFDYWDSMTRLFAHSFSENIYKWCAQNKLNFTGHYWEHGFPSPMHTGSTMPNYEFMQYPGIDMLFHTEDEIGQFGNVLIVKEVSSVGNQLNKERVLSETYGASGWELDFAAQKKVADWQFALGINLVCQHLVHYSVEGHRKRDFPLSFLDHQPWWDSYRLLGDYIGRLSYILSQGSYVADILVLHPSSSIWVEFNLDVNHAALQQIHSSIDWLTKGLAGSQYLYDLGDDLIMERHASVVDGRITIGSASYSTILLPEMYLLRSSSYRLLQQFVEQGGTIIATGATPYLLDGEPSSELVDFFAQESILKITAEKQQLQDLLRQHSLAGVTLTEESGQDISSIYVHMRQEQQQSIYFLSNMDEQASYQVRMYLETDDLVEEWDAFTGEKRELTIYEEEGQKYIYITFDPIGSHLLVMDHQRQSSLCTAKKPILPSYTERLDLQDWQVSRVGRNALPLKQCSYMLGEGEWSEKQDVLKADDHIRKILGMEPRSIFLRQPWMYTEEDWQLGEQLQLKYTFTVQEEITGELQAAIEQADQFEIWINGHLASLTGEYYLDRAFQLCHLCEHIHPGENEIILRGDYKISSGLESIYIVGDFKLADIYDGQAVLIHEADGLQAGDWTEQGYPYYSGKVRYETKFRWDNQASTSVRLELEQLWMVATKIYINEQEVTTLGWQPYQAELADYLQLGENKLVIEVSNSLQNLLGPHNNNKIGLVHPGSFYYHMPDYRFDKSGFNGIARLDY